MNINLSPSWDLTTEHSASSYGQPVLVNRGTNEAYGKGDILEAYPSWGYMPASAVVERLAKIKDLTDNEAINAFCKDQRMSTITDRAKEYLGYRLSIIPTTKDKTPLGSWKAYQTTRLKEAEVDKVFSKAPGLAIICGAVSGGLEVIDVDTKYDLTGSLWDELRALIQDSLPEVYKRLVIAQSKSGGYHIYYRCKEPGGNVKLANRFTIEQERGSVKDTVRVLIETRGEGGYIIAPPTPGYSYIQGEPSKIPLITPEDRGAIFSIARSFNETPEDEPKVKATSSSPGNTPLEDYNQRGDVVALLERNGWRVVNQRGDRINLLRPGQTDSKTSGNYHTGLRVLRVFSSSTEFNPDKGYSPSQVFSLLVCNGDDKKAYRELLSQGYGEPMSGDRTAKAQLKTERIKVEAVNKVNKVNKVISQPGESLRIEDIKTAQGDEIVITSPGAEATEEVLKALELIGETERRIYVVEAGKESRSYFYKLLAILHKYDAILQELGKLTDRQINSLEDEVVETGSRITEPLDKDRYKKTLLDSLKGYGITEESYQITIDRLTSTRDRDAQAQEFKKLLSEATQLQDKGEVDKALELLDSKVKDVIMITSQGLLPQPMDYATVLEEISTVTPALKTGYRDLDTFVGFTPGAITFIAGRPSHGKTTFLYNLLLQMSTRDKGKSFYFFTYEEPARNLFIKLLNRLIDTDLSGHYNSLTDLARPTNYEFIKAYIKAKRTDIASIEKGKAKLKELIDSQKIKVIDRNYSVEELSSLIAYLNKTEPIGGILIDYIQRMRTERRTQDKRTEIAHISDQVLQIAKENSLPIILGAQLNRATGVRPTLENLKETGNLEEDANTVISVYNESRERDESPGGDSYSAQREVELELKALKNREGNVNETATLIFDKWTGAIKNRPYY